MGQFATPPGLADEIVRYGMALLGDGESLRFLDPALGTGAFYSSLLRCASNEQIESATGFEVDPHYGVPAQNLWLGTPLQLAVEDFTRATPSQRFNLLICNPAYVRHHHVGNGDKVRLQALAKRLSGEDLSGLTGLYGYFLLLGDAWMSPGGVAGWLVPSEFMDVNYGRAIKRYLLGNQVTLLRIHRFDPHDVQFDDALVSSAVVWLRKCPPPTGHTVAFSYGGSLSQPAVVKQVPLTSLLHSPKWSRFPSESPRAPGARIRPTLKDLFAIKRGVATGDNKFFILSRDAIEKRSLPWDAFRAVLPPPRGLPMDEVLADQLSHPKTSSALFLLDCRVPEAHLADFSPQLAEYLAEGRAGGVQEGYLCSRRSPWYSQENRPASPFLCTYMGRGTIGGTRPFRFILNHSLATATNVYLLMYPRPELAAVLAHHPELKRAIWEALQRIDIDHLVREGRVYGGGLHKLEPKELANAPADEVLKVLPHELVSAATSPSDLFAAIRE